ncbi:MAG: serine hydrolase domain-containing protein [Ilumatobacter sp.]|uniref:serine hydrolase domain-containing protein n=1 Tax=Ilumatobacter sp. TaxID=1967498 RepID=UPI00391A8CDC
MPTPDHLLDDLLDELFERPAEQGVSLACVAVHRGEVVVERYGVQPANDFQPAEQITAESTLLSWSMAKSMTHAAVGLLVGDGRLDVDAPAPVPEWVGTEKAAITLLQLLEMRPGLTFVEDYVDDGVSNCIEMLFSGAHESFGRYAASLPLARTPGEAFNYSSGTTNIVTRIIGDVITGTRSGPGSDATQRQQAVGDFLRHRLFEPSSMHSATAKFDPAGDFVGSSYVYATARDFARFGELYLHDGVTDAGRGERILPAGWLDHARTPSAHDPESGFDYGRHWWLWPAFPGSLACHGYEGQFTLVVPSLDLVLVHLGKTAVAHNPGLAMRVARLAQSICSAG